MATDLVAYNVRDIEDIEGDLNAEIDLTMRRVMNILGSEGIQADATRALHLLARCSENFADLRRLFKVPTPKTRDAGEFGMGGGMGLQADMFQQLTDTLKAQADRTMARDANDRRPTAGELRVMLSALRVEEEATRGDDAMNALIVERIRRVQEALIGAVDVGLGAMVPIVGVPGVIPGPKLKLPLED